MAAQHHLHRLAPPVTPLPPCSDRYRRLADRAVRILKVRYPNRPRLRDIASELGCDCRTLQRALGKAHGVTFRGSLHALVVAEALDRLVNTDDKVEVIALEVGFNSRSALGKLLRRNGLPSPENCRVSSGTGRG